MRVLFRLLLTAAPLAALLTGCGGTQDLIAAYGGVVGSVTDASNGAVVSGATITVGGLNATSDSSGRFRLANVPTGEQAYTASATGYNTVAGGTVRIQPNVSTNLDIELSVAQTGTGTVRGTVTRGQDGVPLSGVTVTVGSLSTVTDSLGHYELTNVPVGPQTLSFVKADYASGTAIVNVAENGQHEVNTTLYQVSVGTIAGTVVDSRTGTGIEGVSVFIAGQGLSTTTDSSGAYTLANVPAGTHSLSFDRTGYRSETYAVTAVDDGTTIQDVSLVAPAVGRVTGLIRDEFTTLAVSGARVSIVGLGREVTSDSAGVYLFEDVPAGTYEFSFRRSDYSDSRSPSLSVMAGVTSVYDALMRPLLGRVEGFVLELHSTGSTTPLSGATVRLGTSRTTTTASDGSYAFDNVPPLGDGQEYTLYASAVGFQPGSVTVTPQAGQIVVAPNIVVSAITQ
ncbi:MAG TPA: carboxypeptidase regulatory-like domain-containing protein [Armatimonadota bacterium]|nr:carboxypeptidase regulatory-like domain-containing protein [Armatimonadota bacterium]